MSVGRLILLDDEMFLYLYILCTYIPLCIVIPTYRLLRTLRYSNHDGSERRLHHHSTN